MTDTTPCSQCAREISADAAFCPYCGSASPPTEAELPEPASPSEQMASLLNIPMDRPTPPTPAANRTATDAEDPYEAVANAVIKRYRSAYRVGRTLKGTGDFLRGLAVLALLLGGVATAALGDQLGYGMQEIAVGVGGMLTVILTVMLFLAGTLVAAHGETLLATLDTAVHTSPFLTDAQRVRALGLPKS